MDEVTRSGNKAIFLTVVTITIVTTASLFVLSWKFSEYPLNSLMNTWIIGFPVGLVIGFIWYLVLFSLVLPRLPWIASSVVEIIRINKEFFLFSW
jgi:uncharacterized membrane protein